MSFANGCVAGSEFNIAIDGYLNAWNVGPMAVPLASYRGYLPGGNTGAPVFPNGFTIGDFSSDYQGDQRLLDGGPAAPTEVWHLQGDARVTSRPVPGGNEIWTNTQTFTTTLWRGHNSGNDDFVCRGGLPSRFCAGGNAGHRQ